VNYSDLAENLERFSTEMAALTKMSKGNKVIWISLLQCHLCASDANAKPGSVMR
jgi:hypothetical protein